MSDPDPIHERLSIATRWLARGAGALVLLTAVMVTLDVLGRNLWNTSPFHSFEIGSLLFAMAVALGLPYALISGANVRIDVVLRLFPDRFRRWLDFAALLSMAWLGGLLGWFATRLTLANAARDVRSGSDLNLPLAPWQAVWAAGFVILGITALVLAWRHAVQLMRGNATAADKIAGVHDEAAEAIADATAMERTA